VAANRAAVRARLTRLAVAAALAGAGIAVVPAAAGGPTLPTDTQQQVSADRPVPVPPTPHCTERLMTHDFANSYGDLFTGTYTPPAGCPGPWATVVMTLTSTVGGVQFDRDVYVAVGHAILLDGTTSEPCCTGSNSTTWTVQRDVTDLSSLLMSPQQVQVELDNVNTSTLTGIYHTTLDLSFYQPDAAHPAPATPVAVLPVTVAAANPATTGPMYTIDKDGQRPGSTLTFPEDMTRLTAEVFADAHGPCEEFWWSDPGTCAGTPYREVAIYLDGRLAGAAPAYPVTYTGASGPGLWEPIPSPRAWDIRPYRLDLTPFVATLTDAAPHTVAIGVLGTGLASGDFWQVAANLLVTEDPDGARTRGGLRPTSAPPAPTQTITDPTAQGVPYQDDAAHALTFTGETINGGHEVTTTVTETMGEHATQAEAVDATWSWDESTKTVEAGRTTIVDAIASYGMISDLLTSYDLVDDSTGTTTVDGVRTAWSSTAERMRTDDATGLAYNGVEQEEFGYADNAGTCYHHELASQLGEVTVDRVDSTSCPSAPS
jgi:hypothetical protein